MWSYCGRSETRDCQFGRHYFKKRKRTSSRVYLQGTRKVNCPAHIEIYEYKYYPKYAVSAKLSNVLLPTNASHEKFHPTGIVCGPAQKVHPLISKKIEDLVREGAVDANEVQRSLKEYVYITAVSDSSFILPYS